MNLILELFFTFLKIGLFSIGGGYATLPLIQQQAVVVHPWLTLQEFTDIITLSQMTPGPLAVNTSTFVGMRLAGMAGAIAATGGCVLCGILISRSASVGNIEIRFRRFDRGFRRNDCLDRPIRCFLLETAAAIQRHGIDSVRAVVGGNRQRKTGAGAASDPQRAGGVFPLSLVLLIEQPSLFRKSLVPKLNQIR